MTADALEELGRRMVILEGIPEAGIDIPQNYLNQMFFFGKIDIAISGEEYRSMNARANEVMHDLAARESVSLALFRRHMPLRLHVPGGGRADVPG